MRSAHWLVPMLYVVSGLALISDLYRANTLADGIIYSPLVATAVFHKSRSTLWILSAGACLMVIVGAFVPVVASDLPDLIGNRILSILAIIVTTVFVHHARTTQERLADETRRAEAAERIKTDVLTNLSQEIRTPLHSILGVLSLTMATSVPDQRQALGRVRCDGIELLATIDNLLDLTQMEDRPLQRQPVNIAAIAREAAEAARPAAGERQISITMTQENYPDSAAAIGDPWATRRILDTLLANAVRLTPPGGTVSVSVARTGDLVSASVSDTGKELSPGLTQNLPEEGHGPEDTRRVTGGVGLVLSSRLTQAMNGSLTAQNGPETGATVTLCLPAA